jgi:Fe(3+) dicitrate transport protein
LNPLGNPLMPEVAKTVEAGARWKSGSLSAEATLFDMRFDNQLLFVGSSNYFLNLGETRHEGVEASVDYAFDRSGPLAGFSTYATVTSTRAKLRSGNFAGNDVPFYSRNTDTIGARYAIGDWSFNLSSTHQSKQFADEANTVAENAAGTVGVIPGFRVWNAQVRWKMPGKRGVEVAVGVNNLSDKRYFTRTSDTNAGKLVGAPRTVYVQGRVAF